MSEHRTPWKWTRRFAVGLSISVAGFSAFTFMAPFLPTAVLGIPIPTADFVTALLLAAIVGNSQGLANCMAANARRLGAAGHDVPGRWCWAFCFGFAAVSWFGLHNAWEKAGASAASNTFPDPLVMDTLFLFIALSEPTMNWVVDLLKAIHKAEEQAEEQSIVNASAEREARQREAEARRKAFAVAPAVAVALTPTTAVAVEIPQSQVPVGTISHSLQHKDAEAHHAHGWTGPRDTKRWNKFMEAKELRLTPAEIIDVTGIPSTTVYRWSSRLKNGPAGGFPPADGCAANGRNTPDIDHP